MSKAKTLATTVSTGGVLDNPSAIPGANISGAVGSATNLAGGSNGTIPYQSASGTTQMLGVGTASQVLTSAGVGAPTWANPAATGVTSVAATVPSIFSIAGSPITSTGTLAMTYSGTALPIANGGTGTTSTTFANLTTNVTGTLPIANSGTGTTSTTFANLTTNVTGTLPIANGGTNSTATATAGGAGYGTGTAHAYTAAGTSGQVLQSNGASAPTWSTLAAGGGTVTLTSSGAITAGLGVIVNSDGTGSTPALTLAITAKTQSTVASNASANKRATMIYCDSVGVYIAFYSRTSKRNNKCVYSGNIINR